MDKPYREISLDCPENASFIKMRRPVLFPIGLIAILMIMLTACGGTAPNNSAVVHMGATNFRQPSITIKKGEMITFINDSASIIHIIANGTWEHGSGTSMFQEKAYQEPGAPKVNVQVPGGNSQTIGPFNTVGTFHLYCPIHPGMNLTVIVK
jgi:plastocyanin